MPGQMSGLDLALVADLEKTPAESEQFPAKVSELRKSFSRAFAMTRTSCCQR